MTQTLWQEIRKEVSDMLLFEPDMAGFLSQRILAHETLESAIGELLANKLGSEELSSARLKDLFSEAFAKDPEIIEKITLDLKAVKDRDPAVKHYSTALLYFKGFQALQAYRLANWFWHQERINTALYIQSGVSEIFCVDIHPAAIIGSGLLLDHATGIVIGETSILEDNISILQGVTLGGTGKDSGDRHPKIHKGVLIGAGSHILGNVTVGEGAWVGAGSVVLDDVEAHTTVVGVPAKTAGRPRTESPALEMEHQLNKDD